MADASDPPPGSDRPSLLDALATRRRRKGHSAVGATGETGSRDPRWRQPAVWVAGLLPPAGVLIGWLSVATIAADAERATARLAAVTSPSEAATIDVERGAAIQKAAFDRAGPATLAARLAAHLPADARITRLALAEGTLAMEVAVADPDTLRLAFRRDPLLGRLAEVGQRQGDGVLLVALEQR